MRTAPTSVTVNSAANFGMVTYGIVNTPCTSVSLQGATQLVALMNLVTGITSFTVGYGAQMYCTNGNGTLIFEGAEL
jgi:hypothetical protein